MGHPPLEPPPTKASVARADAKKAPWLLPQNQVEATHTPRQDKVENGYGLPTTLYSITHLGHADFSTAATKGRVQEKACFVNKRFHNPSRKNLHMQVAYPETIAKLQLLQGDLSCAVTPPELKEMDPTKRKTRGEERQIPYEETNPADTRMRYGLTLKTKDDRERNKREMNKCQIDFSTAATKGRVQEKACFVNKRFHNPSRKNLHMQVAYPETIAKLQPLQGDLSRAVTPPQLKEMDPTKRKTRGEERQVPYEETNPADTRMRYGLTLKTKDDRERNKREMNRCQIDFSTEPHFSPRGRPTSAPWGTDTNLDAAREPPAQRPAPFYDGDDTSMRLRAT